MTKELGTEDIAGLCGGIAEHAPMPMAMVDGKSHIVRYANSAFCRLMDGATKQPVGRNLQQLLPENDECISLLARVFRSGRPENFTQQDAVNYHPVFWTYTLWPVIVHQAVVGVMLQVIETTQAHEMAIAVNEALVIGSVHQHELAEAGERMNAQLRTEIDHRKQAEESLRESEDRFRSLFASAPMAVFACDTDLVIQQYNSGAVELWGREPACGGEHFGGSLRIWEPNGDLLPAAQSPMADVLRTGVPALNIELSIERADGSRVPVLANIAPLRNGEGSITGAIASFVDLTARKKLEQQALRSQRLESIGTLAGGIAHDLNNSLGPIMLSLELLRMKFTDADSQELLGIIEASAQRGADMVRQILSFARGVEGHRAEVRLSKLIQEMEKIVTETFLRQIQVQTFIAPDLWPVLGDSTQLHQVLLNLCLNARDALPEGGLLIISAENTQIARSDEGMIQNPKAKPGPYVMLEVMDNGFGMPPAIVDNIFDPFFTTKEFGKGSGLGLSTSLGIIKSHGGFLRVTSEPGAGTTLKVFIPAHCQPTAQVSPKSAPETPRGEGELILVVDNEASIREITQQTLEAFGYRVILACDGAEAIGIYAQLGPQVAAVITDMTMPVMEGPEVIRILREINPELPIIAASGLASANYAAALSELGVADVLCKPYTTSALLKMVRHVLKEAWQEPPVATDS